MAKRAFIQVISTDREGGREPSEICNCLGYFGIKWHK